MTSEARSRSAVLLKALGVQGPGWALTRVRLKLAGSLGILERRTPLRPWSDFQLSAILRPGIPTDASEYMDWRRQSACQFFWVKITPEEARRFIGEDSIAGAERILSGDFPFFGEWRHLGFPPDWCANPVGKAKQHQDKHWSQVDEFGAEDIKLAWEVNRFAWAFLLSRAFLRSRDGRYAEAFWNLFEDWLEHNPPNRGINWRCGQEGSFRLMALCFAFYAFAEDVSSSPDRIARFLGAVAAHARRIHAYVDYAISQRNNHAISEGVALWTVGLLFPELEESKRWQLRGRRIIETEVERQVYRDGAYIQHSANYHRVLLHDLAWAIRLGELNSNRLAVSVYEKFRLATRFLYAITDPQSGFAPNYGHNDGARVLPLNDCAYPDMRPVLQCCHFMTEKELLHPTGPWDEETFWLNGVAGLDHSQPASAPSIGDLGAPVGGCYTIRASESWAMLRAAQYKDRPAHADQLHCDLWWRGQNVLCDAGTYSYNGEPPFFDGFASTRYHNTVLVDGADQMTRLTRFMWADWANASARCMPGPHLGTAILEATHDGYQKTGVLQRRAIANVANGIWVVVDDLSGTGNHSLLLHWLLPDVAFRAVKPGTLDLDCAPGPARLCVQSSAESICTLVRAGQQLLPDTKADHDPTRGWQSRYYGRKNPALSFASRSISFLPLRFITVVTLGSTPDMRIAPSQELVLIGDLRIQLARIGNSPVFV